MKAIDAMVNKNKDRDWSVWTPTFREYSADEFRKILITLYGPLDDWFLAARASADFNSSQLRIYRWLQRSTPVTGPAVALADKLIAEHNAKTERKP